MDHALDAPARRELNTLLQEIIRFPTEDPPGREAELAGFIAATLQEWGLATALDEFAPGRVNVTARVGDRDDRSGLVFSAHMDTLPAGRGAWRHPPFDGVLADGRIYGRGAADMKGGLAAMMVAARRLAERRLPLEGPLILAFSAGESSSCLGAKRLVASGALKTAGAILVSEPSSMNVLVAEKGALWVRLQASGTPGQASGDVAGGRGGGDNAVLKIVDAIHTLHQAPLAGGPHPLLGGPALRVGTIQGGSAVNLTPDYAEAGLDIRYLPGMTRETILTDLAARLGDGVGLAVIDDKPPVEVSAGHPFVQTCLAACRATFGTTAPPGGVAYFSDSAVLCPALGIPRVIIGPGELGMSGQRDEYVAVERLAAAVSVYTRIAEAVLT